MCPTSTFKDQSLKTFHISKRSLIHILFKYKVDLKQFLFQTVSFYFYLFLIYTLEPTHTWQKKYCLLIKIFSCYCPAVNAISLSVYHDIGSPACPFEQPETKQLLKDLSFQLPRQYMDSTSTSNEYLPQHPVF